jgi:hypothetical protein
MNTNETTIRLASDGFLIDRQEDTQIHVSWAIVKEIFASKLDLFSCDTIRLGFRVSDDGTFFEVDEGNMGYRELLLELERRFGIKNENWWTTVAFPAFASNRTTLWGEPWNEPNC